MCGNNNKNKNTTTQQSSLPGFATQAYKQLFEKALAASNIPYQPYRGQTTADYDPNLNRAYKASNQLGRTLQDYLDRADTMLSSSTGSVLSGIPGFSEEALSQYFNPWTSGVVDTTLSDIARADAEQQNSLMGRAIQSGASPFGSDRAGLAAATLARNQADARNSTLANLRSEGWQAAVDQFNRTADRTLAGNVSDRDNAARAASLLSGFGGQAHQGELDRIAGLTQSGGMRQAYRQDKLDRRYADWQKKRNYPFETANFLAGVLGSSGSPGGTVTTTEPKPSVFGQILGAVGSFLPFFLKHGGRTGGFSDYDKGGTIPTLGDDELWTVPGGEGDWPLFPEFGSNTVPVLEKPPAVAKGGFNVPAAADAPESASARPLATAAGSWLDAQRGRFEEDDWRMPLLVGGLATMASDSPYALQMIGEGGLAAAQAWMNRQAQEEEAAYRQQQLALQQAQLDAQAIVLRDGPTIQIYHPSTGEIYDTGLPGDGAVDPAARARNEAALAWLDSPEAQSLLDPSQIEYLRSDPASATVVIGALLQGRVSPSAADHPTSVDEYNFYVDQMIKAGRQDEIIPYGPAWFEATRQPGTAIYVGQDGNQLPAPPTNHVWQLDENGNVVQDERGAPVALPVGPALKEEQEAAAAAIEDERVRRMAAAQQQRMNTIFNYNINRALEIIDRNPTWTTGLAATIGIDNIGGSEALTLLETINTLKAQLGFDQIAAMKAAAPTGATGLGQITERELAFIQAIMGSLNNELSASVLRQNLIWIQESLAVYNSAVQLANEIAAGNIDPAEADQMASQLTSPSMLVETPAGAARTIQPTTDAPLMPQGGSGDYTATNPDTGARMRWNWETNEWEDM